MIRLLIADDHEIFREGLRQILADQKDMQVCGEAADGEMVLKRLGERAYDVLVLDMSMPKRSGVALIEQVHALYADLPILVLSMHQEHQYAVQAIRSGAAGYVTKASPSAELLAGPLGRLAAERRRHGRRVDPGQPAGAALPSRPGRLRLRA